MDQQKSLSVDFPYKPAAVRAFYLTLEYPLLDCGFALSLDPYLKKVVGQALEQVLNLALEGALDLALNTVLKDALEPTLGYISLTLERTLVPNLDLVLDCDLVPALKPEQRQGIQELLEQLPDPKSDKEIFAKWWQDNGQAWDKRLRQMMILYRDVGRVWQFSKRQNSLLRKYYDANKLLVDCLNSGCNVSPAVRQQIEETLLLPSANITKIGNKCDRV